MNTSLHELRADFRHHRWLVVVLVALEVAGPVFAGVLLLAFPWGSTNWIVGGIMLAVLAGAGIVALAPIRDHPFRSSTAFWRTRPFARSGWGSARSLWMVLFVFAPLVLGFGAALSMFDLAPLQFWGVWLSTTVLVVDLVLVATTLRALSESNEFLGAAALFLGFVAFVFGVIFLGAWITMGKAQEAGGDGRFAAFFGVLIASVFAALAAWLFVAWFKRVSAAFVSVCFSAAFLGGVVSFSIAFQDREPNPSLPERSLSFHLVDPAEVRAGTAPKGFLLWENVVVDGLEPRQIAVPGSGWGSLRPIDFDQDIRLELPELGPPYSYQRASLIVSKDEIWKRIQPDYPASTDWGRMVGDSFRKRIGLLRPGGFNGSGTMTLRLRGWVMEPRRIAQLPLRNRARSSMADGGVAVLHDPKWSGRRLHFTVDFIGAPRPRVGWRTPVGRSSGLLSRFDNLFFVYDHKPSGAVLASAQPFGFGRVGSLGVLQATTVRMEVELPSYALSQCGGDVIRWMRETELHVYAVVPVAKFQTPELKRTVEP